MSNVLTGKIVVTAPGVEATFQGISDNVAKSAKAIAAFGGGVKTFIPPATSVINNFKNSLLPLPPALDKVDKSIKKIPATSSAATQSLVNLSRVAQDAPYGFIGIANNLNPLLESFQRLKASTGSTGGALKALGKELTGAGGLGLALGVASSLLVLFGDRLFGAGKAAKDAAENSDKLKKSIDGVFASVAKEATNVASLVAVLKSETETRERRLGAIKELQKIQPEIFAGLKLEGNAVVGLDNAYKNYLSNLQNIIAAKIIQARIEQKIEELLKLQGAAATATEKAFINAIKNINKARVDLAQGGDKKALQDAIDLPDKKVNQQVKDIQRDIDGLFKDLQQFTKSIDVKSVNIKPDNISVDAAEATRLLDLYTKRIQELTTKPVPVNILIEPVVQSPVPGSLKALSNIPTEAQLLGKKTAEAFSKALQEGLTSSFESLGEGIGNLLSGKGFGSAIVGVIGDLLNQLGKALIAYGAIKAGLDKILGPGGILIPGGVAIGLGVAAIAFGQIFKNFKGARALGGPVTSGGTYLVGERGPELFTPNTGGRIIPNNQIGAGVGASGGVKVQVSGAFRLSGKDLIAAITLATQSNARLV